MKNALDNIYARCDKHCKSEHCDDDGADYCADLHTEEEHINEMEDFCAKAAFLSDGCEVCQEDWLIFRELSEGKKLLRICQECQYPFELTAENPYNHVCYDAGTGAVYFICDGCAFFDMEDNGLDGTDGDTASWLCTHCGDPSYDCGCDEDQILDLEDEIDRMATLMEMGRI